MKITKEQVLEALILIEKYKIQEELNFKKLSIPSDNRRLLDVGFDARIINAIRVIGVETLGELVGLERDALCRVRNVGRGSIENVNLILNSLGYEYPYFIKK